MRFTLTLCYCEACVSSFVPTFPWPRPRSFLVIIRGHGRVAFCLHSVATAARLFGYNPWPWLRGFLLAFRGYGRAASECSVAH